MLRALLLVLLLSSLAGCSLFQRKQPETAVLVPEKVNINPESLEPCAPLKPLVVPDGDPQPFVAVLEHTKDNAVIYADCAKKQQNSIILLKKFGNITKENK